MNSVMVNNREKEHVISEGKNYIIIKGSFMKLAKLKTQKQCQLGKTTVDVSGLLGHPVGTQFQLRPGTGRQRLLHPEPVERTEDLADAIAADESVADNRNLVADPGSQSLTREEIMEMREQGVAGKEIVSTIVDNSSSFQGKTEYSKEKYVRKKQKKYFEFISVHEPNVRLVASMYYMQDPLKIMNLRLDSLSRLLTACSVRSGGRYLLLESGCLALTVAAVLERLGGRGHLVHLFQGGVPQRHAVDAINFSAAELSCLSCLDLRTLTDRHPPAAAAGRAAAPSADGPAGDADRTAPPEGAGVAEAGEDQVAPPDGVDQAALPEGAEATGDGADGATLREGAAMVTSDADPAAPPEGAEAASGGDEVTAVVEEPAVADDKEESQTPLKRRRSDEQPEGNVAKKSKYARTRQEDASLALQLLSERSMDGLLLCCRQHPLNLLQYLLDFLALSRPFAVFCPYKEPLLECYFAMKAKGCIMLRLTETWLRNYQVLPERTHPEINMSGGGGYLLTGYRVDRSLSTADTD